MWGPVQKMYLSAWTLSLLELKPFLSLFLLLLFCFFLCLCKWMNFQLLFQSSLQHMFNPIYSIWNKLKFHRTVKTNFQTYTWAFSNSFCFWILVSLCFRTLLSGTHSSQLEQKIMFNESKFKSKIATWNYYKLFQGLVVIYVPK